MRGFLLGPPSSVIRLRFLPGAHLVLVGQDAAYVQCTISPVLNRTAAVFPKSTQQQKRAVPALSLICQLYEFQVIPVPELYEFQVIPVGLPVTCAHNSKAAPSADLSEESSAVVAAPSPLGALIAGEGVGVGLRDRLGALPGG